ncbi:hypothetical protein OSB04_005027 [Centaurea solstitialis]|uniref:Reverse transcriptase domain-containing protein n=1 Tax=Centaurea solstitialis TaxID=347529 RepID=A0AA38WG11_9ASTR|nr:hypothetical protein OSB04_005027 [Centaurea solstitialis]
MKIISLNIRGLGKKEKSAWLKDLCSKEKPCMIGVQETKLKNFSFQLAANIWGNNELDYVHEQATGRSGGLLILWNTLSFTCEFVLKESNFIAIIGRWSRIDGLVGCVNVYGPREHNSRSKVWEDLDRLLTKDEIKWVIFGDFNEVRGEHERFNSVTNQKGAEDFNDFIRRNKLIDIRMGGTKYTRVSDDGFKLSKLDRFLTSNAFEAEWKNLRFFNAWLLDDGMEERIKRGWSTEVRSTTPDAIFRDKLKAVKAELKDWRKSVKGSLEKDVVEAKREAQKWEAKSETSILSDRDRQKWMEARSKWLELEERSLSMARQKAKVKWIKDGDENSKFFHAACKSRQRKNSLQGLLIDSVWEEDPKELKSFVFEFFKSKFAKERAHLPSLKMNRMKKLSVDEASFLERRISEEEVWEAINECGTNKSPGPDGFTIEFIKKFWDVIKNDLLSALHWVLEKGEFSGGCNASFLTLIPKVPNPMELNEFRPISLIGIFYKILSKILAERLKAVLGKLISGEQSAFLKGRSILDGVLIANETIDFLKRSKKKSLIFKVDFEKAYDTVEWSFLFEAMENMGFGSKWIRWVKGCLSSARISVLVNGSPTSEFPMERGLRQGDPIAPFLFLIVAEGLHIMVEEALSKGLFKGVKVGSKEIQVSHLQFADDAVFLGEWNAENLENLIKILHCFHKVSGLKMNLSKSKLFGVGIREEEVQSWAHHLGCGYGELPFIYLGLPVGANMRCESNWTRVIEKSKNKLSAWRAKILSFGGRRTLVKSVLGSVSLYFFALFRTPEKVLKILERVRRSFFWGGGGGEDEIVKRGLAWVNWEKALGSFRNGGLNIGGLKDLNRSLLGKWWWRFKSERGGLWKRVIISLYGEDGGLVGEGVRATNRKGSVWSNIIKVGSEFDVVGIPFTNSFGLELGNGENISFWDDLWISAVRLRDKYRRLYLLESIKEVSVAKRGFFQGGVWVWKWDWRRNPRGRETGELENLIRELEGVGPRVGEKDKAVWRLDNVGGFSVRKLRELVEETRLTEGDNLVETEWLKAVPKKVNIFVWRLRLGRLPTRDVLDKMGVDLDTHLCPRCGEEVETLNHAFFTCEKLKLFWKLIGRWWNMEIENLNHLQEFVDAGAQQRGANAKGIDRWRATLWSLLYFIWANRNKLVFEKEAPAIETKISEFQLKVFEWVSLRDNNLKTDITSWFCDPFAGDSVLDRS